MLTYRPRLASVFQRVLDIGLVVLIVWTLGMAIVPPPSQAEAPAGPRADDRRQVAPTIDTPEPQAEESEAQIEEPEAPVQEFATLPAPYGANGPVYGAAADATRFGVATNQNPSNYADFSTLEAGWYHNWGPTAWNRQAIDGVQFYPMVGAWSELEGRETKESLLSLIAECPDCYPAGTIWIVSNEPEYDVFTTKGGEPLNPPRTITHQEYAIKYKKYYDMIKSIDSSYLVATGATYDFLTWVRQEYEALYGTKMPIDVYNLHAYMCTDDANGDGVADDLLSQVKGQIRHKRQMMKDYGDQDKWLIITETGALWNPGEPIVSQFMNEVFDYLSTATSEDLGCPSDGNRLVQRWAWFALTAWAPDNDHRWDGTGLFEIDNGQITGLGEAFADYPKAPPPVPAGFYGTVKQDGQNVAAGTAVTAWIAGTQVANTTAQLQSGQSVYSITIPGDDPDTPGREGGNDGDTVEFKIGDNWAAQTGTWESWSDVKECNLTSTSGSGDADMDGDGKADPVIWRGSTGYWYGALSTMDYSTSRGVRFEKFFGSAGDTPMLADMDGDGKADPTIWRESTGYWYSALSTMGYNTNRGVRFEMFFGSVGDVPLLADLDGDGKADPVIWRGSTGYWYGALSTMGYSTSRGARFEKFFGSAGDTPMLADMDGDGKADPTIWRESTGYWYSALSTMGYNTNRGVRFEKFFGSVGDVPLLADLDGDGKADPVIWRGSTGYWYGALSTMDYSTSRGVRFERFFGSAGDRPMLADLDGDGKADPVIWRGSTGYWYGALSTTDYSTSRGARFEMFFGSPNDTPLL